MDDVIILCEEKFSKRSQKIGHRFMKMCKNRKEISREGENYRWPHRKVRFSRRHRWRRRQFLLVIMKVKVKCS